MDDRKTALLGGEEGLEQPSAAHAVFFGALPQEGFSFSTGGLDSSKSRFILPALHMNSPAANPSPSVAFKKLADRCIKLCEKAKSNETSLPAEREPFLYGTLTDLTQQLELVLRLIEEESEDSGRKEQRKSLLRRLLKRD